MSLYLPENPEEPEEIEYPSSGSSQPPQQESDQKQGGSKSPTSDLKSKIDSGRSLKDKMSGGAGNSVPGKAANGVGGAMKNVKDTAELGKNISSLASPRAPVAALKIGKDLLSSEKRNSYMKGCFAVIGGILLFAMAPLAIIVLIIFIVIFPIFGLGSGEAAGDTPGGGSGSSVLVVSKTVTPNIIPKGTPNPQVTYTITVKNNSDKEAINVAVTDAFGSDPATTAGFIGEITGIEGSYTIGTIAPGGESTKSFTITIPHTDFDPGWLLTNTARASGTVDTATETSTMSATVVIGNPPSVPPTGCPMIGTITTPYGSNVPGYVVLDDGSILRHDGVDLGDGVQNNAPVYATMSGTLTYADYNSENNGELTQKIIITNGIYKVEYFHLSESGQAPEGPVVVGQVIGYEDETGFTDGEHLHYEIRVNDARVNPTQYMSAQLNYSQPANDNFSGYTRPTPWGTCNTLPQTPVVTPPPPPPDAGNEFFIFSDAGEKAWTQAEKDAVTKAVQTPIRSATWKGSVFGAGKVTITRSSVDNECADVCSGLAPDANSLILRDLFFNLTDRGRVFVITHELTHILQSRNSGIVGRFNSSSANGEFQSKGVIVSYPLCFEQSCLFKLSPFNENFAEMAGNYVADRDGYPINFPTDYPEHYKFARDVLFGGTSF